MELSLGRIWIPAGVMAAIAATGIWIVIDPLTRPHLMMGDVSIAAVAIAERYAAIEYATNQVDVVLWTSMHYATNGQPDAVWGGYSTVAIDSPSGWGTAGTIYNGTYLYSGRVRTFGSVAADRGFIEVYTNTGTKASLLDLGPSGGGNFISDAFAAFPRSGWMLHNPGLFFGTPYFALPPTYPLASGWFLRHSLNATHPGTGRKMTMQAVCDPSAITVATGEGDIVRCTYYTPMSVVMATNTITQLPVYDDAWFGGVFSNGLSTWDTPVTAHPLAILLPVSPWYDNGRLNGYIESIGYDYADTTYAADGLTDFSGWTNPVPPSLRTSTNWTTRLASWNDDATNFMFSTTRFVALGQAVLTAKALPVGYRWTNLTERIWVSDWHTGSSYDAAVAACAAAPGWALAATTNAPTRFPGALHPYYMLEQYDTRDTSGEGDWIANVSELRMATYCYSGELIGRPGIGHSSTLGHGAITAHYWIGSGGSAQVPDGETLILDGITGQLVTVATLTDRPGPEVSFGVIPALVAPAPASYFTGAADAVKSWRIDAVCVIAAPDFEIDP